MSGHLVRAAVPYTHLDVYQRQIHAWPDRRSLGQTIAAGGWSDVSGRNLSGGSVALHRATATATAAATATDTVTDTTPSSWPGGKAGGPWGSP